MPSRHTTQHWVRLSIAVGLLMLASMLLLFSGDGLSVILPFLATALMWLFLLRRTPVLILPTAYLLLLTVRWDAAWPGLARNPDALWTVYCGLAALALRCWNPGTPYALGSGLLWSGMVLSQPGLLPLGLLGLPFLLQTVEGGERVFLTGFLTPLALVLAVLTFTVGMPEISPSLPNFESLAGWGGAVRNLFLKQPFWSAVAILGLFDLAQHPSRELRRTWAGCAISGFLLCSAFLPLDLFWALWLCAALPAGSILLTRWACALPGRTLMVIFACVLGLLSHSLLLYGGRL